MNPIEKYERMIEAIKEKANQILPPGSRLSLFGSRARGDAKIDSDWDIHILIPSHNHLSIKETDNYAYPIEQIGFDYNEFISTCVYSTADWQIRENHPFFQNVEKDKVILLSK